ncbi:MAG: dihydropteroate synthase, partial [Firmicutes bacterium]|nr:dihydropteroate synthase [Bacillota bacterium]
MRFAIRHGSIVPRSPASPRISACVRVMALSAASRGRPWATALPASNGNVRELADEKVAIATVTPEVARAALKRGADIINATSGLADPRLVEVVAEAGARVVIMHR